MEWIWSILELEPTTDRSAIRQAYARKANGCHPDEDSEELLRLKQALQAALDYAKANGRSSGPAFGNEAEPNGTRWPAIAEPPEMGENPFRGGEAIRQRLMSSKPMKERSPGTFKPCSLAAFRAPRAMGSLAANTAEGREPDSINSVIIR